MANKTAKQYVTISTVMAANARMVGQLASHNAISRIESIGSRPVPAAPSRAAIAEAGARALQSLKAAR